MTFHNSNLDVLIYPSLDCVNPILMFPFQP